MNTESNFFCDIKASVAEYHISEISCSQNMILAGHQRSHSQDITYILKTPYSLNTTFAKCHMSDIQHSVLLGTKIQTIYKYIKGRAIRQPGGKHAYPQQLQCHPKL